MHQGHDGPRREAGAEAEGHVDQDQQAGDEQRVAPVAPQLVAHARPDELDALDLVRPDPVGQAEGEAADQQPRGVGAGRGLGVVGQGPAVVVRERAGAALQRLRQGLLRGLAELDQELRRSPAVADHAGIRDAAAGHDLADRALVGARLVLEADLHLRAAGEVDAELHALEGNRDRAGGEQGERERRADAALADEVDVRSRRNQLEGHRRLS